MSFEIKMSAKPHTAENAEILHAFLFSIGAEGVTEEDGYSLIYFKNNPSKLFNEFPFPFEINIISIHKMEDKNWNKVWEKNYFKPTIINGIGIRSTFHPKFENVEYEIIIDPKMSFGTGHHQTTSMMLTLMSELILSNKTLIDMGTGTGVLAIHALQKKAKQVWAIDFDIWSVNNSIENKDLNNVEFEIIHGDVNEIENLPEVDVFLANINREVLLNDIPKYAKKTKKGGILLLSGFFKTEVKMMVTKAEESNFKFLKSIHQDKWACVMMMKH